MYWLINWAYSMPTLDFVHPEGVEYIQVLESTKFQTWVTSLPTATIPRSSNAEKAFWINVYNGLTIQTVAQSYPLSSIRDLDNGAVWTARTFVVGGIEVTLDQIEKRKLGKFSDPRIHAALNCASKGCPAIFSTPFTAENLDAQLNRASQIWLASNGVHWDSGWFSNTLSLNQIFDWYASDFPCSTELPKPTGPDKYCGVLQFVATHAPKYTSIVYDESYSIELLTYDWSINAAPSK